MEILKKRLLFNGSDYYVKHLEIINPMLPKKMTSKEMEVLGNFMALEGDVAKMDRFGTSCRKIIKTQLKLSDGGLGNYIKSLKDKGLIVEKDGIMYIPSFLWCQRNGQGYMFRLDRAASGQLDHTTLATISVTDEPEIQNVEVVRPSEVEEEAPYRLKD
jgi:hypothetical protein